MPIHIVMADRVRVRVEGTEQDADGIAQPFAFDLDCQRLDGEAIQARLLDGAGQTIHQVFAELCSNWAGVIGADGQPMPYSPAALQQLLRRPGLPMLVLQAYLSQVQSKAKN